MLVINPRGLFQAVCTKFTYEGDVFFCVIPINEYDGTAESRMAHDRKIVDGVTKNPKILDEYKEWLRKGETGPNDSRLTHEDMGTILVMQVKE